MFKYILAFSLLALLLFIVACGSKSSSVDPGFPDCAGDKPAEEKNRNAMTSFVRIRGFIFGSIASVSETKRASN